MVRWRPIYRQKATTSRFIIEPRQRRKRGPRPMAASMRQPRAPRHRAALDDDGVVEVLIARSALTPTVSLMDQYVRTGWIGSRAVPPPPPCERVVDMGDVDVRPVPGEP